MSIIKLEHITKKYNGKSVLDDFSYVFSESSITCVMGESGVGKTTLHRIILGIDKDFHGCMVNNNRMSAVFQECRMVENISALSNIKMVVPKEVTDEDIYNAFNMIIPDESCKKKVSSLSGGMKRRTEVIKAMLSDSDAIFMDEPFAGLDDITKEKTIKFILSKLNGRILIVITHDKEDAIMLGADICLLTRKKSVDTI